MSLNMVMIEHWPKFKFRENKSIREQELTILKRQDDIISRST